MNLTVVHTPPIDNHPQKTYDSCYFAFLDILGFREIVYGYDHEQFVRIYYGLFLPAIGLSISNNAFQIRSYNGKEFAIPDSQHYRVNSMVVSDSVILWTVDDSMKSFFLIIGAIWQLLVKTLYCYMPMRGAIVHGPLSFQSFKEHSVCENVNQLLIGRAVTEAEELEKKAEWMGCIISQECIDKYSIGFEHVRASSPGLDILSIADLEKHKFISEYDVPFRGGGRNRKWVVNWPHARKTKPEDEIVRTAFTGHHKTTGSDGVQRKLNNTLEFLKRMRPN